MAQIETASPSSIQQNYVNSFKAGFEQAFQQFDSVYSPFVEITRQNSEYDYYDRIGVAEDMQEDNERYGDNPTSEIAHDRRRIGLKDFQLGKYLEEKDLIRVATDPMNEYTVALRASGHRKMDDLVIAGAYGSAFVGKNADTEVTFCAAPGNDYDIAVGNLSKGHSNPITTTGLYELKAGDTEGIVVGPQYDGTSDGAAAVTGITLAKLKAIRTTMLRLDSITQDTVLNCFLTAKQLEELLGIDEIINSDYAVRKSLTEGKVTTFMGYRFIHSERLPADASGYRRCLVTASNKFAKLAIGNELSANMWRDTAKKNAPYIHFKLCAQAVRMWGELTAEMKCAE